MVCLPALVLSETVSVADRDPVAVGVKVMVTRHVPSGLIVPEFGQVLAELIWKSPGFVPLNAILDMFRAMVVLVSVSVELFAALVVPTVTEPKLCDAGSSVAVASATVPVPVRLTV
jgi:hypothetical protein